MSRRVVVTGLGAVTPLGSTVAETWDGFVNGRNGVAPVTLFDTTDLEVQHAAEVRGFSAVGAASPKDLRQMERGVQFALVAAREAVADARLPPDPAHARRRAAVFGAAVGQHTIDAAYDALYGAGGNRVSPLTVPRIMPNAPASHVSMEFGLRGPVFAVASACASANHAIGQALALFGG